MEEKRYSLKELYQLVTDYYEESDKENFDPAIGDFVDWIAARDQYINIKPAIIQGEFECKAEPGTVDILLNMLKENKPVLPAKLRGTPHDFNIDDSTELNVGRITRDLKNKINEVLDYLEAKEKNNE